MLPLVSKFALHKNEEHIILPKATNTVGIGILLITPTTLSQSDIQGMDPTQTLPVMTEVVVELQ